MRRLGDVLPDVASQLGIEGELTRSRQMIAWQRLVAELVPSAAGASALLAVQPPALVVSATSPIVAQELRLRAGELLSAFGGTPEGVRLFELRVVVRPAGGPPARPRGAAGPRVD
ncbi:MAG TPA: DciA family protein [Candidatus Caenarcaniphilales bacterium]|nr:DciA family protein [Candidatus Caenarcaniphilales bacterium]